VPRPLKCRRVSFFPQVDYFKPAGMSLHELEEVLLSLGEAEAVRLKDLEGMDQETGAENMNVSRPTFQRILASGRKKMADALLNGKSIRIEGGKFEMALSRFRCRNGHEWDVPFEVMSSSPPRLCPQCNSSSIRHLQPTSLAGKGNGIEGNRRRGRNH
jgi:predicted DNA-binding protein (UPF0251 family)